jgi:thiol-disulfide isomerase/thioredoxin
MNLITLTPSTRALLSTWIADDVWLVACLCARWCDLCESYQQTFAELAARHPTVRFVWIDIEDQADLAGDMEVDNFPTLLIQHGDLVTFFGTLEPQLQVADGLIKATLRKSLAELQDEAGSSALRRAWQQDNNLRAR